MPGTPDDGLQSSLYEDIDINNSYDFRSGVCVLPVAEDPPTSQGELASWSPVVIARLHAPYRIRKMSYGAHKANAPPVIPSPNTDNGKTVFVAGGLAVSNSMNQSYNSFDWTVLADYTYVENCVSRPQDGILLGSMPFVLSSSYYSSLGNPPSTPPNGIGAISQAGVEAKVGYTMGQAINFSEDYFYTIPSYIPGVFFSDSIANSMGVPDTSLTTGNGTSGGGGA